MDPHSEPTVNALALTKWRQNQKPEAVGLLSDWIGAHPNAIQSRINRGLILRGRRGLADLDFVLEKIPNHPVALKFKEEISR